MQACYIKKQRNTKSKLFFTYCVGTALLITGHIALADHVVITGNKIINKPTIYKNDVLDMTNGRFTINNGGSLQIEDSTINSTISPTNPHFAVLSDGNLSLKNNTVKVTIDGITPNANIKPNYHLIQIQRGAVNISDNTFTTNTSFVLGFFETQEFKTDSINISNNAIKNFHGGVYLYNSHNATINTNSFENVSYANIFCVGNLSTFSGNIFSFPGNLTLGDALDVVNSNGLTISDNVIASGSNYGIYIVGGKNITIVNNKITDGLSYAITIETPTLPLVNKNIPVAQVLSQYQIKPSSNSNIIVNNNYMAQNRYGLTGGEVDQLTVTNNTFIQKFANSGLRQYWTNNDILLSQVSNFTWTDNIYKEAFTQEVPGDNANALQFKSFPKHGGVNLP
jgi:parallel beta-helix repeat protein